MSARSTNDCRVGNSGNGGKAIEKVKEMFHSATRNRRPT